MKKRVVSLIISAFIVCSCILTVMASSGLDLNVLRKGKDIQYAESNRDDLAAYALSSLAKIIMMCTIVKMVVSYLLRLLYLQEKQVIQ